MNLQCKSIGCNASANVLYQGDFCTDCAEELGIPMDPSPLMEKPDMMQSPPAITYQATEPAVTNMKLTNPKDVVGSKKLSFAVLPWRVLTNVALAMLEGALKYGRHNYRAAGVRASVYFDAVVGRHITDWWEGTDIDPDSGLHHLDKAIAGLMVMRDSMLQGNFVDDRPPHGHIEMAVLNAKAAALHERYSHVHPTHYTIESTL